MVNRSVRCQDKLYTAQVIQCFAIDRIVNVDASVGPAHLKQFAVVPGFTRNAKLATAVQPRHDGHDGTDLLSSGIVERRIHVRLLAELDQVTRGRKRQLESSAVTARK